MNSGPSLSLNQILPNLKQNELNQIGSENSNDGFFNPLDLIEEYLKELKYQDHAVINAKKIVEEHGGRVELISEQNRGTKAIVVISVSNQIGDWTLMNS